MVAGWSCDKKDWLGSVFFEIDHVDRSGDSPHGIEGATGKPGIRVEIDWKPVVVPLEKINVGRIMGQSKKGKVSGWRGLNHSGRSLFFHPGQEGPERSCPFG